MTKLIEAKEILECLPEEIQKRIQKIETNFNSGLPYYAVMLNKETDMDLWIATINAMTIMLLHKKGIRSGFLIDIKGSYPETIIEVRYARNREERKIIKETPKKKDDHGGQKNEKIKANLFNKG